MRRRLRRIVAGVLVFLAMFTLISGFLAKRFIQPQRIVSGPILGLSEETVAGAPCFVTKDWRDRDLVYLLIHGYGGNRETYAPLVPKLQAIGAAVIIPSMPGHDTSPVADVGFGKSESALVRELAREVRPRKVVAVGVSLGGAAVWQAAAAEPELFDAVATEGTYPDLNAATDRFLNRTRILPIFFAPMLRMAESMTGIDPTAMRPIDGARVWRGLGKPVAICHGEDDRLFPVEFGERLAEAAGTTLWRVPHAGHAQVQHTDLDGWATRLIELAEKVRGQTPAKR